jgi:acetylornithine deacetylase/succinyl-diaminopimelate desuccinylase-like protein
MIEDKQIVEDATSLLRDLIRIDTSNPPGNEAKAAEFLSDYLMKEGLESEILESDEGRGSIITRYLGEGERSLMLLSHLDVVPAKHQKGWSVDPFSGVVKDGFVWGRGALDCKSLVAIEALTLTYLKREGFKPKGTLLFTSVADEEQGGDMGAKWLVENHPEKVRVDLLINEGGGEALPIHGRNHYVVQVAEKGVFWTRLRTKGTSGHASRPWLGENALHKMSRVIDKLGSYKPPQQALNVVQSFVSKIDDDPPTADPDALLARAKKMDETVHEMVKAMLQMTIVPTMIKAGVKENIIPDECEAVVDCRLLPGQDSRYLKEQFTEALGSLEGLEIEPIQRDSGTISPHDTELFRIIEELTLKADPEARCVPFMALGGTDSRFFREKFGTVAYGFQPLKMDLPLDVFMKLPHGVDERISQDNLVYGTRFLVNLVKRVLG